MFLLRKNRCTQETTGTIIKKRWNGNAWHLTIEYFVDGHRYCCSEQLRYKITKTYRLCGIPIGFQSVAVLENIEIGTTVRILYNPKAPRKSYLPDNAGLPLV